MGSTLQSTDAKNKLEDLSGIVIKPGENPYDALIRACNGDPAEIQVLYSVHRVRRNEQQKEKFLAEDFKELIVDPFLLRIERPEIEPGFKDWRNCLVLWARPPDHIIKLCVHLQVLLKKAAPHLWLMPPQRMHMTTLEITHSQTPETIYHIVTGPLRPVTPILTNYTYKHRSRLVKPQLSYDLSAIAISFLPAAGEAVISPAPVAPHPEDIPHPGLSADTDAYSYHHLRRDTFDYARCAGLEIESRYVTPSAHVTLGRFLGQEDH